MMGNGYKVTSTSVEARMLKATQTELNGASVAGISKAMSGGATVAGSKTLLKDMPIFATKDGYIIDGHHRWAAVVAQSGKHPRIPAKMNVIEIDSDIIPALAHAQRFTEAMGMPSVGVKIAFEQPGIKIGVPPAA